MRILAAYLSTEDDGILLYDGGAPDLRISFSEILSFAKFTQTKDWSPDDIIAMLNRIPGYSRDCSYRSLGLRQSVLNNTALYSLSVIKYICSSVNIALDSYSRRDLIGLGIAVRMSIDALSRIYIPAWAGADVAESIYKEHCDTGKFGRLDREQLNDSYLRRRLREYKPSFNLEVAYHSTSGAVHPSSFGPTRTDVQVGLEDPEQYGLDSNVADAKLISLDDSIRPDDAWTDLLRTVLIISSEVIFTACKWISNKDNPLKDGSFDDSHTVVIRLTNDDVDEAVAAGVIQNARYWDHLAIVEISE